MSDPLLITCLSCSKRCWHRRKRCATEILFCLRTLGVGPNAGATVIRLSGRRRRPPGDVGMLFNSWFSAPLHARPSRAAILTGQYPHRLEEGSCLWGFLPRKFPFSMILLERRLCRRITRKRLGAGQFPGRRNHPKPRWAAFKCFGSFLRKFRREAFCFWFAVRTPIGRIHLAQARSWIEAWPGGRAAFWPDNTTGAMMVGLLRGSRTLRPRSRRLLGELEKLGPSTARSC